MRPGRVLGVAGGGLRVASWAVSEGAARRGWVGERRTASLLDDLAAAPGGVTVLHDLMVPQRGYRANIDHIVVRGRDVFLLDSKMWQPGFYWRTRHGHTRRGWTPAPHADKRTLNLGRDVFNRLLVGTGARLRQPVMVVWPSNTSRHLSTWALVNPEQATMTGHRFSSWARRTFRPTSNSSADPAIVEALSACLAGEPAATGVGRRPVHVAGV